MSSRWSLNSKAEGNITTGNFQDGLWAEKAGAQSLYLKTPEPGKAAGLAKQGMDGRRFPFPSASPELT